MSRQNPPSTPGQESAQPPQRDAQPVELERGDQDQPLLKWVVVENPDQSFLLHEDDYVLDSYFNPEYDVWEMLVRLQPPAEE